MAMPVSTQAIDVVWHLWLWLIIYKYNTSLQLPKASRRIRVRLAYCGSTEHRFTYLRKCWQHWTDLEKKFFRVRLDGPLATARLVNTILKLKPLQRYSLHW